jgi:hypothetical protein
MKVFSDKNQDENQIDNQDTAATDNIESRPRFVALNHKISDNACDDNQGYQHKDNT